MSLQTSPRTVETLQSSLHAKAKAEPAYRFYSLWDKVCREDVLREAYRRCRAKRGAPGADCESFELIESAGVEAWLESVRQELKEKTYRPAPLLRVWIPKANGGERALGIPTVRDRVVQMAMLLIVGPIFEADLMGMQYGFRQGKSARAAIRNIQYAISMDGMREVVDADLADYFNTIPHGALMRSVSRRICDSAVLSVIRAWLRAPVVERRGKVCRRTTGASDRNRGTPQGGVISPLLANLYFRRFLLAWYRHGHARRLGAKVVNYADDVVILCPSGRGEVALETMKRLMSQLGLTVNEKKTRLAVLPRDTFDFLGHTIGRIYGHQGKPYWGTRPSKKAVRRLLRTIYEETSSRWSLTTPDSRVKELNQAIGGWVNYFRHGPVVATYRIIQLYANRRLRRWLMRKRELGGMGYRRYPDKFLYETLGLVRLPAMRSHLLHAKA